MAMETCLSDILNRKNTAACQSYCRERADREAFHRGGYLVIETGVRESGITAEITGRAKHIYSIYQKLKNTLPWAKILMIFTTCFALRVVVDTVPDCLPRWGLSIICGIRCRTSSMIYRQPQSEDGYQSLLRR